MTYRGRACPCRRNGIYSWLVSGVIERSTLCAREFGSYWGILCQHYPIPTERTTPDKAAAANEHELKSFYGAEHLDPARPRFDVTLLGLGPDGQTASLFPNTAVLAERDRWVAAVVGAKSEARITLTYLALESSRNVAFLVAGEEKRAVLARLRRGDDSLPSAHLHPTGTLWIFGDAAAAGAVL